MNRLLLLALLAVIAAPSAGLRAQGAPAPSESSAAIDADVWSVISATVAAGDVVGMGNTYHPDAVLVNSRGTASIAKTLIRWGEGMAKAKREGTHSTVAFRFSLRQDGPDTAFETGIFALTETNAAGVSTTRYIPLECLLVKRDGKWRILMERQFDDPMATWQKLAP